MDLRTSTGSEGVARLRAVQADGTAEASLAAALEGADSTEDLAEQLRLLRDAATLLSARQRLDGLLLQLAADPFDPAAYRGLGSYLAGPGQVALAAHKRVHAATAQDS